MHILYVCEYAYVILCCCVLIEIRKSFYILQRSVNATASPLTSSWSPVRPCLACVYAQGLVCTYRARWALSWVCECGLLCLLHLGLHMAQQTTAGERGRRAGAATPSSRMPIWQPCSPAGHWNKCQMKRSHVPATATGLLQSTLPFIQS